MSQEQQPQERRGAGSGAPANQQPRSRREARDAERRAQSVETAETGELSNVHPSGAYDLNASGNIWDTVSRTAASQLTDAATEAERRTGRRVADRDREHTPAPEPLSYVTQARPNIPTYDAPSFRDRLQQVAESAGATSAAFRERDFAPTPTAPAAPAAPQPVVELDYHTQTRTPPLRPMPAASTPAAPAPVAPTRVASAPVEAPEPASTLDHTLTRRELRVLRETGAIPPFTPADLAPREGGWQATPDPAPASVSPPVGFREPAPLTPVAGIPLGSAFTSYEDTATAPMSAIDRAALLADEPVQKKSRAVKPASDAWEGDIPLGGPTSAPVDAPIAEPVSAAPAPRSAVPTPPAAEAVETVVEVEDEPDFTDAPITGLLGFEALIAQASTGVESPTGPVADARPLSARQPDGGSDFDRAYTPPAGHWSVQAEREDDSPQPFDGLLSRNVGSSSGSTNALIMPSDPQPDLMHALNSTGEILVTGSLDLPRSLSSTGATSDHYDSSEIDRLFEASQEDHHNADVAPVRAARAVSTHTSTRSVVSPRKSRGGNLPFVLAITAAVMAAGVIAVLITSIVTGTL
ncbi:hypothetical protein DDQ50_09830 [Amnibacterium flavum]|uniref:Uncharacterized protein n=1 Tax=Amnibacterium flavum TaxID=2173173 RepID=A0A2V1HNH0_9MICO|nr:hypothetical protein DDQ50_09830 [Amnibacterium flavum]